MFAKNNIMMKKLITLCLLISIKTCLLAQNIMISNQGNPSEPSILINPNKPNILVAGANLNYCYASQDTGRTWVKQSLTSPYGVWGDPALAVDTANNFYFFHLSNPPSGNWIDRIVCQKSVNAGKTWSTGTFTGLNGTKAQDKQWPIVDRNNNNIYLTWTQFDKYGSSAPLDSSIILFSKSTDAGNTWSTPKRINKFAGDCIDSDNTVEGATPAVGINGEIYVSWAGPKGLVFNKSLDQGNIWLKEEKVITSIPGGWDYNISGLQRANGLPVTVCDLSQSANRGTIYINWTDQRNGTSNTDVWLVKSTDGGETWSVPIKVNDDNSNKQQFFTWMTIDQTNGNLYFVFYDRRNYSNNLTDVYMAISTDGGNTFINKKISESPFLPNQNVFFGDYTNITAHNNIIRPIWTRLNNGELSIWTNITKLKDLLVATNKEPILKENLELESYPNPSDNETFVSFKLHSASKVSLSIFNEKGNLVSKIIDNENREYGKYVERIDLNKLNIGYGLYLLKLEVNGETKVSRQIKLK
jgi:hypothetical protein